MALRTVPDPVAVPILLRRFERSSRGEQPVAFLAWATVSDAVKAKLEVGETLELADWTSGDNLVVADVVSPFNPAEVFEKRFLEGARGPIGGGEQA